MRAIDSLADVRTSRPHPSRRPSLAHPTSPQPRTPRMTGRGPKAGCSRQVLGGPGLQWKLCAVPALLAVPGHTSWEAGTRNASASTPLGLPQARTRVGLLSYGHGRAVVVPGARSSGAGL
mgnify:CR=1 FL=1